MKLLYDQEEAIQMYGESERYEEKVETAEHLIGIGAFCGAQRPQMRFRAAALRSKTATRLMQVISC